MTDVRANRASLRILNASAADPATAPTSQGVFAQQWSNIIWIAPFLAVYLALLVYPFFQGLWMSMQHSDLFSDPTFVGLENYQRMFTDKILHTSIRNTLLFVVMTVPTFLVLGLFLALSLNRETRSAAMLRTFFFGTNVLSVTIVALVWKVIYLPDGGPVAGIMEMFGADPIPFLNHPSWALGCVAIATIWWGIGLPMVLFLAGLQQIPREIYEAAALDNAGRWTVLFKITLPALRRTTVLVIIVQLVLQFQVFSQIQLLTGGGPNNSSRSLAHFVYNQAFQNWDLGYAAAASQLLFVLILIPAMLQYSMSRQRQE